MPTKEKDAISLLPPGWEKHGKSKMDNLKDGTLVINYCDDFWRQKLGSPDEYLSRLTYLE